MICKRCQYCPAVQSSSPGWLAITDILQGEVTPPTCQNSGIIFCKKELFSGWRVAVTDHERWLQSVLNNVVYYLNEPPDYQQNESDYALPDSEDTVSRVRMEGMC